MRFRFAAAVLIASAVQVQAQSQPDCPAKGLLSALGINPFSCEQRRALERIGNAAAAMADAQNQQMSTFQPMQPIPGTQMQTLQPPPFKAPTMIYPMNGGAPAMLIPMN